MRFIFVPVFIIIIVICRWNYEKLTTIFFSFLNQNCHFIHSSQYVYTSEIRITCVYNMSNIGSNTIYTVHTQKRQTKMSQLFVLSPSPSPSSSTASSSFFHFIFLLFICNLNIHFVCGCTYSMRALCITANMHHKRSQTSHKENGWKRQ